MDPAKWAPTIVINRVITSKYGLYLIGNWDCRYYGTYKWSYRPLLTTGFLGLLGMGGHLVISYQRHLRTRGPSLRSSLHEDSLPSCGPKVSKEVVIWNVFFPTNKKQREKNTDISKIYIYIPRKSKDQSLPIGSRESFTWMILKTILCLALDFQGTMQNPPWMKMYISD